MKKIKISVAALCIAGSALTFQSCIGSFSLTSSVLNWNKNVGNKFVNELVFVAFFILPVYEVTAVVDLLVLNSIEFWKGKNPYEASVKTIETQNGTFIVKSDKKGYTIIQQETGLETRLEYDEKTESWNYIKEGEMIPIMTFVDDSHVKMITPDGNFQIVELSESGVLAYQSIANVNNVIMASR